MKGELNLDTKTVVELENRKDTPEMPQKKSDYIDHLYQSVIYSWTRYHSCNPMHPDKVNCFYDLKAYYLTF